MERTTRFRVLAAFAAAGMLCLPAAAQERVHDSLVPVEAYVEDSSALSTSLRQVQYGIQIPYGFEQLMREDTPDGRYVRQAAGLWAVFPRSEYVASRTGYVHTWPADTYFHIGPPRRPVPVPEPPVDAAGPRIVADGGAAPIVPEAAAGKPVLAEPSDGWSAEVSSAAPPPPAIAVRPSPPRRIELITVPFVVDARYRRDRIRSIVEQANRSRAQAARGPSPSSSK